jgi:hypothetical protein
MVTDANTWFKARRDALQGHIMLACKAYDMPTVTKLRKELCILCQTWQYFDKEMKRLDGNNGSK